jgi:hypothetical protein
VNSNGIKNNYTQSNAALGYYSIIDYFITSDLSALACFNVIQPSVNLSDHRPIITHFLKKRPVANHTRQWHNAKDKTAVTQLRWDHADLLSYYHLTGLHVQKLLQDLIVKLIMIVTSPI